MNASDAFTGLWDSAVELAVGKGIKAVISRSLLSLDLSERETGRGVQHVELGWRKPSHGARKG